MPRQPVGENFDLLARALANGLSRRQALLQLGALVVADLVGGPLRIIPAAAQADSVRGCPPGLTLCGAACNDLGADPQHCGSCGNACPFRPNSIPTCANGACGFVCNNGFFRCENTCCPTGETCCDGACINPAGDAGNCGACGRACPAGLVCHNNACIRKSCSLDELRQCYHRVQDDYYACAADCPAGSRPCQDGCFDALAWGRHNYCDITFRCPVDTRCCNGFCTSLRRDIQHCGACGNACPIPANSTPTCTNGACGFVCNTEFFPCGSGCCETGNACCNGVCTSLSNDPRNCGACGQVCPVPANSTATCTNGMCGS